MDRNNEMTELKVPEGPIPEITEYTSDILVVGSGYAGIAAAIEAKKHGLDVILADKGNAAFSGCSPWAQSYQFFNKEFGDDEDMQMDYTMVGGEYIANLDWYKIFLEESYDAYKELEEWKIYAPFPKASECEPDYYHNDLKKEYHEKYIKYDRRLAWRRLLRDRDISVVNKVMITDVIIKDKVVCGALGFDVPSGTVIRFNSKSIILATGNGIYKNTGYPVSGNSFDGEYICYNLGLPIIGYEFEKVQGVNSYYPDACWNTYSWGWLENLNMTAGASQFGMTLEAKLKKSIGDIGLVSKLAILEKGIKPLSNGNELGFAPRGNAVESLNSEKDDRTIGNTNDKMPKRDIVGGCIGSSNLKCAGVFCGLNTFDGFTGIPGLYVAGDLYGSMIYGASYTPGQGGSLPVSQIMGKRSGKAAVDYIETIYNKKYPEQMCMDTDTVERITKHILDPLQRETGFNPRWATDILHNAMAPFWVSLVKSEKTLNAALVTVEMLKNRVLPLLIARNSHELRLVHEVNHKVLAAEIKLRLSLERKESRGSHFREDYPYRDDDNFLCYIVAKKGEDGCMVLEKVPVKEEWAGDRSVPYEQRYPIRFPGEIEARGKQNGNIQS